MRVDRAREAALDALAACRRNGAWIDGALKPGAQAGRAFRPRCSLCQPHCLRRDASRIYLDRCLARLPDAETRKSSSRLLLDILRIGAYQILLMDKVPVNAAVNEAVEMAKAHKLSPRGGDW